MENLFQNNENPIENREHIKPKGFMEPNLLTLAERMRPKSLDDFIGQEHILGKNKPLRLMIEKNALKSIVLWGPPGSGKTSIALLISTLTNAVFFQISAVSASLKDVRNILKVGEKNLESNNRTILFIDEIHRFNKAQQDSLLHSVENGQIILIGATTENPSFEVISPLLSRCFVFVLNPLTNDNLNKIMDNAIANDIYLSKKKIIIEDKDLFFIYSSGDARIMLNALELAVILSDSKDNYKDETVYITKDLISAAFLKTVKYDKSAEEHYNTISAFIKSMRGSNPDAAVYWLARMLKAGEDPKFIARRMIILASEDIGNANPDALGIAVNCFNAVNIVGLPEARIVLSQAAIYLSACPKSNASYKAIESAIKDVNNYPNYPVPLHLRNAITELMKKLGYGKDYKYPHDFENNFVSQDYLPEELKNKIYYKPGQNGYEKIISEKLKKNI